MALTDSFPGSFAMEAIDTSQHCPIRRRDDRPSPNRVTVDAARKPDDLHQIEPTPRSDFSCEPLLEPLQLVASAFISWSTLQRVSIIFILTA